MNAAHCILNQSSSHCGQDREIFTANSIALALLGMALVAAGCSRSATPRETTEAKPATPPKVEPWFEEVAAAAGVDFRHTTGHRDRYLMPEIKVGGVGLFDYDADGLLDLYCIQGGSLYPDATNRPPNRLFHNLGNWRFEDVTAKAGVQGAGYGNGCACADYDGDGDIDLYVTNLGTNILYRNNGNGTFTDVTRQAGVGGYTWGTSAAFFDYDGDGRLDLVVANYLVWSLDREINCYSRGGLPDYCSPLNYRAPARTILYHNKGDGTFEDVTHSSGLDKAYGHGLGVLCADFNRDGRPDIYLANDATPNQLWINQGNGCFVDEGMIRGCAVNGMGMAEAGMGVAAVDLNEDGWFDIFITHLIGEGNRLFMNRNGYFTDAIQPRGPGAKSYPFTGFGMAFTDFDHDGELDLYVSNGMVRYGQRQYDPNNRFAEPDTLLRGLGGVEFEEVPNAGLVKPLLAAGRGAAFGDLDNDGAIDIVIMNRDGPLHVLRNVAPKHGHAVTFRVLDRQGHDALNALLRVDAGGRSRWQQVQPCYSYMASNDPRLHFGLGLAAKVDRVRVWWPGGSHESFGPFAVDGIHTIRQGTGQQGGAQ